MVGGGTLALAGLSLRLKEAYPQSGHLSRYYTRWGMKMMRTRPMRPGYYERYLGYESDTQMGAIREETEVGSNAMEYMPGS